MMAALRVVASAPKDDLCRRVPKPLAQGTITPIHPLWPYVCNPSVGAPQAHADVREDLAVP